MGECVRWACVRRVCVCVHTSHTRDTRTPDTLASTRVRRVCAGVCVCVQACVCVCRRVRCSAINGAVAGAMHEAEGNKRRQRSRRHGGCERPCVRATRRRVHVRSSWGWCAAPASVVEHGQPCGAPCHPLAHAHAHNTPWRNAWPAHRLLDSMRATGARTGAQRPPWRVGAQWRGTSHCPQQRTKHPPTHTSRHTHTHTHTRTHTHARTRTHTAPQPHHEV
jgi:hypothetical protein